MSQVRFQHVFLGLMGISAISAFAVPVRYTNRANPGLGILFAPITRPSGALAGWLYRRLVVERPADPRDADAIRRENQELKSTVASLSLQLEDLAQRNAERQKLGQVRDLCTPVPVAGADAGARESLSLRCSTLEGIVDGMYVLYAGGVVGQIERAGVAGAQVRLVTDPGFRVRGNFGMFRRRPDNQIEFTKLNAPNALIEGMGRDSMAVRGLSMDQVKMSQIAVGNWVILAEPDWPENLQGQPLGKVISIRPRPDAPLYAEVRIEPQSNLSRLREVMVVTKEK